MSGSCLEHKSAYERRDVAVDVGIFRGQDHAVDHDKANALKRSLACPIQPPDQATHSN